MPESAIISADDREHSLAMSISIPHPVAVEAAARTGCRFVVLDDEQVVTDKSAMYAMILAAHKHRTKAMVRLGSTSPDRITAFLGLGAGGLLLPGLRSAEEVQAVASYAKYPPVGRRGLGANLGTRFDFDGDWSEIMPAVNDHIEVHVIVETAQILDDIEAVASLEIVDCLDIGVLDLSASLGMPGDVSSPLVQSAMDKIIAAADRAGKRTATAAKSPAAAEKLFARGITTAILDPIGLMYQGIAPYQKLLGENYSFGEPKGN